MKAYILLLFLSFPAFADEWTSNDTKREAVYLTLLAIDWAQTRDFLRNPAEHEERNPILGKQPHQDKVDLAVILTGISHVYIAKALPYEYREAFQYISIGAEMWAVTHNFSVGVKLKF